MCSEGALKGCVGRMCVTPLARLVMKLPAAFANRHPNTSIHA